jgi:flagellar protein FlaG
LPALQAAIIDANRALRAMNRGLEFELDPASGRLITRLVDTRDNEVLRQIPSEEMLRIAEALDRVQGLLIEQHA